MRPLLPFILFFIVLFSTVALANLNLTTSGPVNNEYLFGSVLFLPSNTTGREPANFSIRSVAYYFELANGTTTLFANITRAQVGGADNYTLSSFNTTNNTVNAPFLDILASGNFARITINVSHEFFSINGTVVGTSSSSGPFVNTTTITGLTIDNTMPTLNLQFKDSDLNVIATPFEFEFGDTVNIDCNPVDATAGISNVSVLLKRPEQSSFGQLSKALNGEAQFTETDDVGEYEVQCIVYDKGSKYTNSTKKFQIITKPPRSTSGFKVAGFEAPIGKKKVAAGNTNDAGSLTTEGLSRLVQVGGTVILNVKGTSHKITVSELSAEQVTLVIASEPVQVTIKKGDTATVDIDNDGTNDVSITFHKRFQTEGKYADVTFMLNDSPATPVAEEETTTPEAQPLAATTPTTQASKAGLWITLLVIIVVIIIGYVMIRGKKR